MDLFKGSKTVNVDIEVTMCKYLIVIKADLRVSAHSEIHCYAWEVNVDTVWEIELEHHTQYLMQGIQSFVHHQKKLDDSWSENKGADLKIKLQHLHHIYPTLLYFFTHFF